MLGNENENEDKHLLEQVLKNQAEIEAAVLAVIEGCELYIEHLLNWNEKQDAQKYIDALDVLEKYEMIERE
jgi:hypothetical protein